MPTEELQSIADAANGTSDVVMFTTGFDGLAPRRIEFGVADDRRRGVSHLGEFVAMRFAVQQEPIAEIGPRSIEVSHRQGVSGRIAPLETGKTSSPTTADGGHHRCSRLVDISV